MGGAEAGSRHLRPRGVRDDVGDGRREQHLRGEDQRAYGDRGAPEVAAQRAVAGASRTPERHSPDDEEHKAAERRHDPGEVVAGRPAVERVVRGLGAGEDAEEADEERKRGAHTGTKAAVERRSAEHQRKRHEPADQVVGSRGAWVRLKKVVVDNVQRDEARGHAGEARLRLREARDRGPDLHHPRCAGRRRRRANETLPFVGAVKRSRMIGPSPSFVLPPSLPPPDPRLLPTWLHRRRDSPLEQQVRVMPGAGLEPARPSGDTRF